eukprot:TRINITY_DN362_c1_g2_i2.p1 TRINITY_DN362_c1_g2~~TRINITY_DN362_c1_g2_i2.p1  ORF type:complete len:267 (+),score=-29.88 TRINITY_DN362_c1_g2_i2:62-862(+)
MNYIPWQYQHQITYYYQVYPPHHQILPILLPNSPYTHLILPILQLVIIVTPMYRTLTNQQITQSFHHTQHFSRQKYQQYYTQPTIHKLMHQTKYKKNPKINPNQPIIHKNPLLNIHSLLYTVLKIHYTPSIVQTVRNSCQVLKKSKNNQSKNINKFTSQHVFIQSTRSKPRIKYIEMTLRDYKSMLTISTKGGLNRISKTYPFEIMILYLQRQVQIPQPQQYILQILLSLEEVQHIKVTQKYQNRLIAQLIEQRIKIHTIYQKSQT